MRPALGRRKPLTMENSVVLPAPLGPSSAVMRPRSAENEAPSTASRPPKRFETFSTCSRGSDMRAFPRDNPSQTRRQARQRANDPARRKRHHQDEDAAVDNEVEAGRIANDEFGQLAQ